MSKSFFITGTDTDVGKTYVTRLLLQSFNQQSLQTAGFKPISAGCEQTAEGLRNEDALILQQASSVTLEYDLINPVAFEPPVAPHLAAEQLGVSVDMQTVNQAYSQIQALNPDITLVEGAGGWRLPLGQGRYLSDFAIQHKLPVILVVGMRLGCLNHALLTAEAIRRDGLSIAGWVANHIDPDMDLQKQNIASLKALLDAPFLGVVPYAQSLTSDLDLTALL